MITMGTASKKFSKQKGFDPRLYMNTEKRSFKSGGEAHLRWVSLTFVMTFVALEQEIPKPDGIL